MLESDGRRRRSLMGVRKGSQSSAVSGKFFGGGFGAILGRGGGIGGGGAFCT